jgi:hypothetical protein
LKKLTDSGENYLNWLQLTAQVPDYHFSMWEKKRRIIASDANGAGGLDHR